MIVELDDYEVANLREALHAAGQGEPFFQSPLSAMNTGDWVGMVYSKLPDLDYLPNQSAMQMVDRAREWMDDRGGGFGGDLRAARHAVSLEQDRLRRVQDELKRVTLRMARFEVALLEIAHADSLAKVGMGPTVAQRALQS